MTAIERTSKKEANLKTSQDYLEFQARQTGVRLLDAAFDGVDSTVFHAPGAIDNCIIAYNRTLGGVNSTSYSWWDSLELRGRFL